MTHNQHRTTTVQVQMSGRTILDSIMHKLPSRRKYYRREYYRVQLIIPDNGIPIIEYSQATSSRRDPKSIQFVDLLFADQKHDTQEKFAFSIYTIDKTTSFLAQDEATMNDWLSKIKECHSNLYPEFKRYEAIFEVDLLNKELANTMNIQGAYRVALCKESLDLIPLQTNQRIQQQLQLQQQQQQQQKQKQQLTPNQHRFHKRHPLLSQKTIQLFLTAIRRCGHTGNDFYVETGRYSQIGEGGLWMTLKKEYTARQLHELLLAAMKLATPVDDQFIYKTPRSRSGSSSENAHRSQQSRASSLICLAAETSSPAAVSMVSASPTNIIINNNNNNNSIEEDNGYLPMA